mmetsp:Transcript_4840/g.9709  ORF Transcript_4840/g.9709 Transcript_4840/m.9709 type:complete len:293 (-) Transcript_4840:89-967(-)
MNNVPFSWIFARSCSWDWPGPAEIRAPFLVERAPGSLGRNSKNSDVTTPVFLEISLMYDRIPINSLDAQWKVSLVVSFRVFMSIRSEDLSLILLIMSAETSEGTSTLSSSHGSRTFPDSSFLYTTVGGKIDISYPSLLIVSKRIPSCNSPRPRTSYLSLLGDSRTSMATFVIASFFKRVPSACIELNCPSCPWRGDVFTETSTNTTGGSIALEGSGWISVAWSGEHSVSVTEGTVADLSPVMLTMSPAPATGTAILLVPFITVNSLTLMGLPITFPSLFITEKESPFRITPA